MRRAKRAAGPHLTRARALHGATTRMDVNAVSPSLPLAFTEEVSSLGAVATPATHTRALTPMQHRVTLRLSQPLHPMQQLRAWPRLKSLRLSRHLEGAAFGALHESHGVRATGARYRACRSSGSTARVRSAVGHPGVHHVRGRAHLRCVVLRGELPHVRRPQSRTCRSRSGCSSVAAL